MRIEQCKRDAEEMRAKIATEEVRLQKDVVVLREVEGKIKKRDIELD